MCRQGAPQRIGRALVKQHTHVLLHQVVVRLCSANSSTATTCSWATPGNHARKSATVAPSARFSNSDFTGTRVPRKTHAPLKRSAERSTAEQRLQSSIVI